MSFWEIVSITSTTLVGFTVGFFVGVTTPIKIRLKFDFRRYLVHRDGLHQEIREEEQEDSQEEQEDSQEEQEDKQQESSEEDSADNGNNRNNGDNRETFTDNTKSAFENDEEMNNLFFEEEDRKYKSQTEIQLKGLKVGAQPVSFPIAKNGNKYLNNSQLQEIGDTHRNFQKLSKRDEIDIINTFQTIVGTSYKDAVNYATQKGYMIYAIEVEQQSVIQKVTRKIPITYDARNIGVKIRDEYYDWSLFTPSGEATVIEIKNVGIVD